MIATLPDMGKKPVAKQQVTETPPEVVEPEKSKTDVVRLPKELVKRMRYICNHRDIHMIDYVADMIAERVLADYLSTVAETQKEVDELRKKKDS